MAALATIISTAMRIDKDPAVDGPRALIAEFFGLWIAFSFLAWSFMTEGSVRIQWILRGIAAGSAIISFTLASWFAGTPEVRESLGEEPTGFDKSITTLKLHEDPTDPTDTLNAKSSRRECSWTDLTSNPEASPKH